MTLEQIRRDKRVYSVESVKGDGWSNENVKYEFNLKDGYCFSDGSHCNRYCTVKEMSEELKEVKFEGSGKRCGI